MEGVKLSSKQFNSFIDKDYGTLVCVQRGAVKQQSWVQLRSIAESGMNELREMLKSATKEEQIVLSELIELKIKELEIIYNHIKRR